MVCPPRKLAQGSSLQRLAQRDGESGRSIAQGNPHRI